MYNQGNVSFVQRDVISKFHVPTTFLAACAKKNIVKADIYGTKYIGPEPDVKLAVELFDFEKQNNYTHTISWYLALCYLKNQQTERAKFLLEEVSHSDSQFKTSSTELLEELN